MENVKTAIAKSSWKAAAAVQARSDKDLNQKNDGRDTEKNVDSNSLFETQMV